MKKFEQTAVYILGTFLLVGGIYTLYITTAILFGLFGEKLKAGNYIPITLICSLICSFLYLAAGLFFFKKNKLATPVLFVATIIMFIGYIGMLFHINNNKPFDLYIIPEMLIRTTGTMLYAAASWYLLTRTRLVYPAGHNAKTFKKLIKEYETKKTKYSNPNYR